MGMILTGRRVSAQEGLELGFVNEVASASDLMAVANKWAELICECSPMSIRASKETVHMGLEETLAEAIGGQFRYPAVAAMFKSADFVEGPMAFAQKRAPQWTGK
jgi:enoyl-CoA hydratase/carnithine racemase